MKISKITLLFLLLIFILPLVAADTTYSQVGGNDTDYNSGTGFFNSQLTDDCSSTDITCSSRNIASPDFVPLAEDLNNDGIIEIIIVDGTNVRLYQNSTLDILDAFVIYKAPNRILIYDIDGDNNKEILLYEENINRMDLEILEYNGTTFYKQTNFTVMAAPRSPVSFACRGVNDCAAFGLDESATPDRLHAIGFNSTGLTTPELQVYSSGTILCPDDNSLGTVAVADYDNDGNTDYILTVAEATSTSTGKLVVAWVSHNTTNLLADKTIAIPIHQVTGQSGCSTLGEHTSPLVFDFDGSTGNGLETIFAFMKDDDEYRMRYYSSNGILQETYPQLLSVVVDADGTLISNMIRANVFTDTGNMEACVMGYQQNTNELDLLCASATSGTKEDEFPFSLSDGAFNVTSGYHTITHATQMSQTTTDGTNLDEFVNAYGIFTIDYVLANELLRVWENPKGDSAVVPVDVQGVDREDLLMLSTTNLWYIDDGFSNSQAEISEYTINPCIDRTWKQNTSVQITVTPTDTDGDKVSALARLYNGESDVVSSGWSVNATSGTTFTFNINANQTTSNSVLKIFVRDVEHITTNKTLELTFSVSSDGAEFGDCTTTFTNTSDSDADVITDAEVTTARLSIKRGLLLQDSNGENGLDDGYAPLFAFVFIALGMWTVFEAVRQQNLKDPMLLTMIPLGFGFIGFLFFTWLRFIPAWIVVMIGLAFVTYIAITGKNVLNSSGGDGGL